MKRQHWLLIFRVGIVAAITLTLHHRASKITPTRTGELRTSPSCDHIVGYSGPTDCRITLDARQHIARVDLVHSFDTRDHVAAVRADPDFLRAFIGIAADDAAAIAEIDAVSGATLTSAAILSAVGTRLGHRVTDRRFPDPITLAELQRWFRTALHWVPARPSRYLRVTDAHGEPLGRAVRTGPDATSILGYQGPSDVLLAFDQEGVLLGFSIRASFDNERYVGYVGEDAQFAARFVGKHREDLARIDLPTSGIDGVSGATMTSTAIARHVVNGARTANERRRPIAIHGRDIGLAAAVVVAILLTFSRLRKNRLLRLASRLGVIAYLGLLTGDMLSQGMLLGWARDGVAWLQIPGLALLAGVALLVPAATGQQPYCHQLCPHGAAQELLRRVPGRWQPPARVRRALRWLPGTLLVVAVWCAAQVPTLDLGALEPFGAWAFPIAGWATCAIAVVGLVASCFVSMVYCRFGCPTGALLQFVRRRGTRDRFAVRDWVGVVLLIAVTV